MMTSTVEVSSAMRERPSKVSWKFIDTTIHQWKATRIMIFSHTIAYALLQSSVLFSNAKGSSLCGSDYFDSSIPICCNLQANQVALYPIKETEIGATGSCLLGEFEQRNRYNRTVNIQPFNSIIYEVKTAHVGWASNLVLGDDISASLPVQLSLWMRLLPWRGKTTEGLFNHNLHKDSHQISSSRVAHKQS